jgi:hypothetical protein
MLSRLLAGSAATVFPGGQADARQTRKPANPKNRHEFDSKATFGKVVRMLTLERNPPTGSIKRRIFSIEGCDLVGIANSLQIRRSLDIFGNQGMKPRSFF